MKMLLPKTLAGQTTLVLLTGLMFSHLISMLIYSSDRINTLNQMSRHHIAQRVVSVSHLLNKIPAANRAFIATSLSEPSFRISLTTANRLNSSKTNAQSLEIKRFLTDTFKPDTIGPIFVQIQNDRPTNSVLHTGVAATLTVEPSPHQIIKVTAQLRDKQWLNIASSMPESPPFWSRQAIFSISLMGLLIVILTVWVVRRLTTPLRDFAHAAERLGKDVHAPSLPVSGVVELQQAAQAFNKMQGRLQRLIDNRTRMLAAISHDLRTPITLLRLRSEVIEDTEERNKSIATLDEMESMIASTLQLASEDAKTEPNKIVDISALLESICIDLDDRGLVVERELPDRLLYKCRSTSLKRAFSNIIENAFKFAGNARVQMTQKIAAIEVIIEDDGPGIPATKLHEVFSPFYRIEPSRNQQTGGAGLGLSISQSIIHAHGGEIVLSNHQPNGLRVQITLPT